MCHTEFTRERERIQTTVGVSGSGRKEWWGGARTGIVKLEALRTTQV